MPELSMEKYAKKRNKQLKKAKEAPAPAMPAHEPKYDLDTLTRAEEIRRDKLRHRAAKNEAKQQQKRLASVITGGKRSPAKVKEA